MKKLFALIACAMSVHASAQTIYGIGAKYDYDSATENNIGLNNVAQTSFVGGVRGKYGQLDGALYEVRLDTDRLVDHIKGAEIGYGPGFTIGNAQITTRAAFGQLSNRYGHHPTAYYRTFTVGVAYPLSREISPYVSYRYRPGQDLDRQNQFTVGIQYQVSKQMQLQTGFRQTRNHTGPVLNGLTSQLLFLF